MASLPEVVQRQGVKVSKSTRNYLMIVGLISEDGSMDGNDLRDYAVSNLEKVLARVPGVGEVEVFGAQYAMRVWLEPRQADRLRPDDRGRDRGAAGLQRGGLRRPVRRHAGGRRPAAERLDHRAEPAQDARGVRRHSRPHQSGRLGRAGQGRGPDRTGDRVLRHRDLLQRQARRRPGHPPGARRQRPGHRRRRQGEDGGDEPLSSRRA